MKNTATFKGVKYNLRSVFKKNKQKFRRITLSDLRRVFFPKNFYEKYGYLGSVPYDELGQMFQAMEPLVIFLDYKAKPKFCPRWFLRLLRLYGNDNSIVRMRNFTLSRLLTKLTKGIMIWDYKTKWQNYDLRISVSGSEQLHFLADAIEDAYYDRGRREDLADQIKMIDPNTKYDKGYSVQTLTEALSKLPNDSEVEEDNS